MASRSARGNPPLPSGSARQNEYFVPRDGIDREVITADICRYLGNDALVRPGVYENRETGQVVQGYFINAYRNLTTAMIEDLKADSARWEQERRQQAARNSAGVQYRNSDTHQSRQYYGPTESANYPDSASRDPFESTPRYPGTGTAGYNGASGTYSASYGAQGGYAAPGYTTQQGQFNQPVDPSYTPSALGGTGFGQTADRPYVSTDVNMTARGATYGASSDPYGAGQRERIPVSTVSQSRTTYVTAGGSQQPGYAPASQGYYQSPTTTSQFAPVQPQDPFYGRGTAAYSAQDPQYAAAPPSRSSAAPTPSAQIASNSSSSRRERDSVDRHSDRHHHSSRSSRR